VHAPGTGQTSTRTDALVSQLETGRLGLDVEAVKPMGRPVGMWST
jgi:hypothetical protein